MITAAQIGAAVGDAVATAACSLRPDVLTALEAAEAVERSERGRAVLRQLIDNAALAARDSVPLCQDTGSVWVRIELGADDALTGDIQREVDSAVADAYRRAGLRMSMTRDALFDRDNSGDNTPAFVDVVTRAGSGATVSVMLKGGGSDNASRVEMLPPDVGIEGVRRVLLDAVAAKATGACPPLVIGVGVGTTFDKVAGLAKKALLRPICGPAQSEAHAALEAELLAAVNATGIGPAGLGGDTTALAVHLATAPSHIAGFPVAINMGCCAMRSVTVEVTG